MANRIKVFIVADFEPLRLGLENAIAGGPDMKVTGSVSSLEAMATSGGFRGADVLVVDMAALAKVDTDPIYARLQEWVPGLKVLFLGSAQEAAGIGFDSIPRAVSLHNFGFLLKDGPTGRLIEAIRLIASDAFVCEAYVIKRILTRLTQWAAYSPSMPAEQLSDRETEVLTLVAQGASNKEIARDLFLSEGTVKAHISHIMLKLGMGRRTELVRYALTSGVVSLNEG